MTLLTIISCGKYGEGGTLFDYYGGILFNYYLHL